MKLRLIGGQGREPLGVYYGQAFSAAPEQIHIWPVRMLGTPFLKLALPCQVWRGSLRHARYEGRNSILSCCWSEPLQGGEPDHLALSWSGSRSNLSIVLEPSPACWHSKLDQFHSCVTSEQRVVRGNQVELMNQGFGTNENRSG
jgi:hypothetical protein